MNSSQLKGFKRGIQDLRALNLNESEAEVFAIKCHQNTSIPYILSSKIISEIELVKFEFDEINRLFDEKISDPIAKKTFSENLEGSEEIIGFLVELCAILKRIQPYWEVIDGVLVTTLKAAIEQTSANSMRIKEEERAAVCEEIKKLEESKMELSKLYYYVFAQMEWFVLFYRASSLKDKEKFFSKLHENSDQIAWIAPFIEIAEQDDLTWEMALTRALNSQENSADNMRRVYV